MVFIKNGAINTVWTLSYCVILYYAVKVQSSNEFEPSVIQIRSTRLRNTFKAEDKSHNISIEDDQFVADGVPLRILSGSLHYFRLPAELWRDRLQKLKAAGLNSVSTYVEWSYHEPEEREYLFDGDHDVARFIRTAAEEGLHVLLRPGPYICAERDLGGLPYWLLGKYPNIRLRSVDKDFINETSAWMAKLFEQVSPLLFGNGGPVVLVQVENEYGSYGSDKRYMGLVRDILIQHVGTNALLYTTDGASNSCTNGYFVRGSISGALTTIDFGTGTDVNSTISPLRCFMPHGPVMNSEFYPGWLTHWGESMARVSTGQVIATLTSMLDNHFNVNFYMFFGGTNFEYSAGANFDLTYMPDITSYDYDAPLSEAGDPTPKYYAIRDVLKKYNPNFGDRAPPAPSPKGAYGPITVTPKVSLLSSSGRTSQGTKYSDVTGATLPTFEALRQRAGLILYEIDIDNSDFNKLVQISEPRDRIYVFVNNEYQGVISRSQKIYSVTLLSNQPKFVLSLLVENQGRINYGSRLHDFKGILGNVKLNGVALNGTWSILGYPLKAPQVTEVSESINTNGNNGPVLYEGTFSLEPSQQALDTFIDTTGWGKGYIWVNGKNLGRYWPKQGPQVTLYLPGVWVKPAPETNHVQILELEEAPSSLQMKSIDHPILDKGR